MPLQPCRTFPRRTLVVVALLAGLTACNDDKPTATPGSPSPVATVAPTTATPEPSATVAPTTTATATPSAAPTPTPTPGETAPAPGAPTCRAATLTVTDADTLVTTQYREQVFTIRTSGPDCGLTGYPAVSFLGDDGKALALKVSHGGYGIEPTPAAPISLSKGTSVSFSVASPRSGSCASAATLVVTLPGTGAALRTATTARFCQGVAGVSPVRRLSDHD